jgi:hypothetical protein
MFEHTGWFKPYVAGYYAFLRGLPDDPQYVLGNMDGLLDITKLPKGSC